MAIHQVIFFNQQWLLGLFAVGNYITGVRVQIVSGDGDMLRERALRPALAELEDD